MPVISTNTAANSALRYLNLNSNEQSSALSKLASGSRITKASDDAAGLAIGTRVQSDVTVLSQSSTNASQAIAILQTADGGAARVGDILQRMKALATQSDSGSVTDDERTYINSEYSELLDEIDGITSSTRYNGEALLDGTSQYASASSMGVVTSNAFTSDQAEDLTTAVGATEGDIITIQTSYTDEDGTATTNDVAYTMVDYDGDSALSLQDVVDSINAGDTSTPESANVQASIKTDSEGRQSLVLTVVSDDDSDTTDTISDITATTTTGTTNTAVGLGLIDSTGAITGATDVGVKFMVGTTSDDTITLAVDDVSADALTDGTNTLSSTSVDTQANAEAALSVLDAAISQVSQARASIGATMSRFEFRSETIDTSIENLDAAQSAIMDADVAAEKSDLSTADVKTQAAVAALSQASQMPQNLLSLLKS